MIACVGWSKSEMKKERRCHKSDEERRKKKKSEKVIEQWKTLRMRWDYKKAVSALSNTPCLMKWALNQKLNWLFFCHLCIYKVT